MNDKLYRDFEIVYTTKVAYKMTEFCSSNSNLDECKKKLHSLLNDLIICHEITRYKVTYDKDLATILLYDCGVFPIARAVLNLGIEVK